jgi:hypothetical protein
MQNHGRHSLISIASLSCALIGALTSGFAAFADTSTSNDEARGTHWPVIIESLRTSGVQRVGDFDLKQFREQADEIQWNGMQGAPAAVLSGSRKSAFFLWDKKQVYISEQLPSEALASLPQLELHEALGATGYNDHDYSLSTALDTLSKLEPDQRTRLEHRYGQTIFRTASMRADEGGVSVSGGGDLTTLYVKDQVLKLIMGNRTSRNALSDDFIAQYPSINFEPLQDKTLSKIYLKYQYLTASQREKFSLFIPMGVWNKGGQVRDDIIHEAARKVTEVFPSTGHQALRTFHPSSCPSRGNQIANYPTTQDLAVASIQDFRAGIKFGCRSVAPGLMERIMLAPALDREQVPHEAGNYNFKCEFHYGSASISYAATTTNGQRVLVSKAWSVVPGDYLDGTAAISGDGKIEMTFITYEPPGGQMQHTPFLKTADPTFGQSETMINGRKLTFGCRKAD